jgi:hypothetical protein
MEKPQQFADILLAEGKGWSATQVKEQWDNGVNSAVSLDRTIPVHMTYFTVVVDETGKVSTFPDLYGFDRKVANTLFGNNTGFPAPPPDTTVPREDEADASSLSGRAAASHNDIAGHWAPSWAINARAVHPSNSASWAGLPELFSLR